ncbi:MAG: hypothetical protein QM785_16140 [Pyrinomonadaceae bacterium]
MRYRKVIIPITLVLVFAAMATGLSAQSDWVKLGEKDVDFGVDHDTIGAESKGAIREIHLRVMHAPIKFKKVVINYKDGEKKELEYLEDVEVGKESRSINIEGDGHAIKSIDLWYETDKMGGKKAKVAVYGRS